MRDDLRTALYARVSSEQQAGDSTIASQLAALEAQISDDDLTVLPDHRFADDGYSGATLVRPALERLRDLAASGALDRVYVHSPDRLARRYAYQVLLVDELHRAGVEIVFLNRQIGVSPEDDLLLQVQGMVAEYERAKILERSRRGKRHGARRGSVNVLAGAPYGYRYLGKHDSGGVARYEIVEEQARVVRQVFDWVGRDRASIGEVCRRLRQQGCPTRGGKTAWDRTTVWAMLRNPAYKGEAAFGKTRVGPLPDRLRPVRGGSEQPRRAYGLYDAPAEDWISIPCRGWSTRRCSTPFASSLPRTAAGAGRAPGARATSCRAFWCATLAGTPITAKRSACALRKASGATTPTTGAAAPTPTAMAASACARTVRSAPTGWTRRSGARSSGCCTTRPGSPRNTSGASTRHGVGEATALTLPRPRRSWPSCAGAWAG